jgi:hypothetical protein
VLDPKKKKKKKKKKKLVAQLNGVGRFREQPRRRYEKSEMLTPEV